MLFYTHFYETDPAKQAEFAAEYQRKAALLKKQNAAYRDYCAATGQKPRPERLEIARWDRSQAAKAAAAAKKRSIAIENGGNQTAKKLSDTDRESVAEIFKTNAEYRTKEGIFDLESATEDYREFLTTVSEPYKIYLEQSFESVDYTEIRDERVLIAYLSESKNERFADSILYNPAHENFDYHIFSDVNTHELAHRIDYQFMVDAGYDRQFNMAIANAKKNLIDEYAKHLEYCKKTDKNGFISDVMSVISEGQCYFPFSHSQEYWSAERKKGRSVLQIFFRCMLSMIQKR